VGARQVLDTKRNISPQCKTGGAARHTSGTKAADGQPNGWVLHPPLQASYYAARLDWYRQLHNASDEECEG